MAKLTDRYRIEFTHGYKLNGTVTVPGGDGLEAGVKHFREMFSPGLDITIVNIELIEK